LPYRAAPPFSNAFFYLRSPFLPLAPFFWVFSPRCTGITLCQVRVIGKFLLKVLDTVAVLFILDFFNSPFFSCRTPVALPTPWRLGKPGSRKCRTLNSSNTTHPFFSPRNYSVTPSSHCCADLCLSRRVLFDFPFRECKLLSPLYSMFFANRDLPFPEGLT